MPQFHYRAVSTDGQTLSGVIAARERTDAIRQLKDQGVKPLDVQEQSDRNVARSVSGGGWFNRVTRRDIQTLTAQLAALLKAGIVLSQALAIMQDQSENEALTELITSIRSQVHDGKSLSDAMATHPREFNPLYCSMVRVGESGGILDTVLRQVASFMEAEDALRSNVTTALAYPVLVMLVGLGSIFILVWFVIPRLSTVFADFGGQLPWMTRTLIGVSDFLVAWGWVLLLLLIGAGYLFRQYVQTPAGRESFDRFKERLPILGSIIVKAEVARFARTMGILIKSGIPVLTAIELVTDTTRSSVMANGLRQIADQVRRGEGLAKPLRESGLFPPMAANLMAVGEQSGSMDEMLFQIAETYDVEVQHAIKRFITLFEPLVIILMAIGVGGVLFAFLLPIMNIGQVIG